jgi:hypothetical protein
MRGRNVSPKLLAAGSKGVLRSMVERFRPDPAEFERCVRFLCKKIEMIVVRSGVSDVDCADLEGTLAAMPPTIRERTKLMLDGVGIATEYDEPVMMFAARYILSLARTIWAENPHPMTHETPPRDARRRAS